MFSLKVMPTAQPSEESQKNVVEKVEVQKPTKKERRPRSSRKSETPKQISVMAPNTTSNQPPKLGLGQFGGSIADCDDLIKQLNEKENQNIMSRQIASSVEKKSSTFTMRGGSPQSPGNDTSDLLNGDYGNSNQSTMRHKTGHE